MSVPIDIVLARLEKVTGKSPSWMSRCPAHDDRTGSLHITEKPDGRVIFHCHAGCGGADVVQALGLQFGDLKPLGCEYAAPEPVERNAQESLRAIAHAALVAVGLLNTVAAGKTITDRQADLAAQLAAEIMAAMDAAGVKPTVATERRVRT
ncbi:MAG: hypothetical protein ACYCXX_10155 [Acidiferrobacter thiooxydans]